MPQAQEASTISKYLTVSRRDKEWQIYCTCYGSSVITPGADYPPRPKEHPDSYLRGWQNPGKGRVLDEFQLIYITEGKGSFISGDTLYGIDAGTAFILFPGVPHWYCPDSGIGWKEYWTGFKGEYPEKLVARGFLSPAMPVHNIGLRNEIIEDFHRIRELGEEQFPGFQHRTGAAIISLLANIVSFSARKEQSSGAEQLVTKARFIFEENLYNSVRMEELADILQTDYGKFRELFKEYTGLSPYQFFLQLKIHKAKQFLRDGELSVKEISYRLGFENQYYFSRIFKNKTGVPPTRWRARSKGGDFISPR